ncbi:EcsC family protein [Dickeya dianthicola]|uniref:EcsC family protein n=1 Tax=Dickeya dianthicola TaxID=204039 RepID=UPI0003A80B10|nr:EcsC family protein [Dickeya dianthicola]MCI4069344.1 EcsC family protein [Dickeya dianthicola]MCI4113864.1 EcsC family protein [Dickeya dianthicola]MCI4117776.1 EcsC family protein [Dickeya dianthicola]MCI4121967.1 EcsC family protein [Dickeya dianthicola]MCI4191127.1 EcsC family protein [Dickeya dianthicola]
MAEDYLKGDDELLEKVNSLIRWKNTKSVTTGFVSGLGGIITLPVTIPASIATVMYVQIRMITAIAIMGGYDVRDDRVKSLVYTCLAGNAAKDILKETGIIIGTKMSTQLIQSISKETIFAINKFVGFRLLTKFGEKGAINLGKMIPLIGGVIGGALDGISTNVVGNIARETFIEGSVITES